MTTTRYDRIVDVACRLDRARKDVERLTRELEQLLDPKPLPPPRDSGTIREAIVADLRDRGSLHYSQIAVNGIEARSVAMTCVRMAAKGQLVRESAGVYALPEAR